jgi:hypothetical protein
MALNEKDGDPDRKDNALYFRVSHTYFNVVYLSLSKSPHPTLLHKRGLSGA